MVVKKKIMWLNDNVDICYRFKYKVCIRMNGFLKYLPTDYFNR